MCITHTCVGYFLEVHRTSFNFQLCVQSIALYNLKQINRTNKALTPTNLNHANGCRFM